MGTALVAEYGAQAVQNAIRIAVGRPREKRHWGYVKGVLEKDSAGMEYPAQAASDAVRPRFVSSGGETWVSLLLTYLYNTGDAYSGLTGGWSVGYSSGTVSFTLAASAMK